MKRQKFYFFIQFSWNNWFGRKHLEQPFCTKIITLEMELDQNKTLGLEFIIRKIAKFGFSDTKIV